jgi:DNA-binding phage protein
LINRLKDPKYAAAYLTAILREDGVGEMLEGLKDVVTATSSSTTFAKEAELSRSGFYRMASRAGNPTVTNLREVLIRLGLDIQIIPEATTGHLPPPKPSNVIAYFHAVEDSPVATYVSLSGMTPFPYPLIASEDVSDLELVH